MTGVDPNVLQAKADIVEDAFRVLEGIEADGKRAFSRTIEVTTPLGQRSWRRPKPLSMPPTT